VPVPPLRVAALVKQVPRFEAMELGAGGRLVREGIELELNPYCRRAVSKAVELVGAHGGSVTVITLGPPAAEDALREALAWADQFDVDASGILVTDPAFAGSDTLATARALAAAVSRLGPFDLLLTGRNSVDADTGQVAPELAELLDLPFLTGVRTLELSGAQVDARCEYDDGWVEASVPLPAVLSCAERLCEPAKVDPPGRAAVDGARIVRVSADDLGPGPWGQAGSPTSVGPVRVLELHRERRILSGPVDDQVREAVRLLADRGALGGGASDGARARDVAASTAARTVVVLGEPDRDAITNELAGAARGLAATVLVVTADDADVPAEDFAVAAGAWISSQEPWAVLAPSTVWGREVASRIAARLGAGLTGDAVGLEADGDKLVAWKPAFGGALVAAIECRSAVQMATVRPGVLPAPSEANFAALTLPAGSSARGRVVIHGRGRDDNLEVLANADVVVGVGTGVGPDEYELLDPLLRVLGAELGATRKVTDKGWLPRARQIGITGRSIAPRLYVAIGVAGKFNHMVGVRAAGTVVAVNREPDALVFDSADLGIVGDWHDVVPLLAKEVEAVTGEGGAG
jgi:electron transfer flavoprotein alpha subunit